MKRKKLIILAECLVVSVTASAFNYTPLNVKGLLRYKTPGNPTRVDTLRMQPSHTSEFAWGSHQSLPLVIKEKVERENDTWKITVTLKAKSDVYFHFGQWVNTGFRHKDCLFYLPGFWYRLNLRSPKAAPSFHTSDSWTVREDRLSTPLTAIYNKQDGKVLSVLRTHNEGVDALTVQDGRETLLSGTTTLGYTGFENQADTAVLSFGFPYQETPKSYIRKLTLASPVQAFQYLKKGQTLNLSWELQETTATDYADCISKMWNYSYDTQKPQPLGSTPSTPVVKKILSQYFKDSYVENKDLCYFASPGMRVDDCKHKPVAEVGFVGRTLLNALNALEYGEKSGDQDLTEKARRIFQSYCAHGFTSKGWLREWVNVNNRKEKGAFTIRRQSEGLYALLYYLDYERSKGRKHPEWEKKVDTLLKQLLGLQQKDGSFPRKFHEDLTVADASGGSTSCVTLPLIMGYHYFQQKSFRNAARKSMVYIERNIISPSDYFSSTLDANCEDKEASLYAATAAYYMALASKGKERAHYQQLMRKAAYFALSWYYTWDVPFAAGEMLGDMGLKTRGWGNVSVENNHIDVYVFDFTDVLAYLSQVFKDKRFENFGKVIRSSLLQLLPYEGHLCGVAKEGYYPEVVQHTNWDYGKNGKGFYNDIFAPGWTVASLWEMLTPGRAASFFR